MLTEPIVQAASSLPNVGAATREGNGVHNARSTWHKQLGVLFTARVLFSFPLP